MPSHRELARSVRRSAVDPDGVDPILALRWADFNSTLMRLDEAKVAKLFDRERKRRRRLHVLLRLQSRLSKLRRTRELAELTRIAR